MYLEYRDLNLLNVFEIKYSFRGFNLQTHKQETVEQTAYIVAEDENDALEKFKKLGKGYTLISCEWYLPSVYV